MVRKEVASPAGSIYGVVQAVYHAGANFSAGQLRTEMESSSAFNSQDAGLRVSVRHRNYPQIALLHAPPKSAVHSGDTRPEGRHPPRRSLGNQKLRAQAAGG